MPKTITPTGLFTDATLRKTQEITADSYGSVWIGPSGEESSGEAVARHLEGTAALLDKDGWSRVTTYFRDRDEDQASDANPADDESLAVKQMIRAVLRFLHDGIDLDPRRTLDSALHQVGEDGAHGDPDTARVTSGVLDRLIQAHTGSASARATAWSERQHRTHADITALLRAGARFARTYGPAPQAT
ncbi:DUF6197 family protein [Streptomyces arboris]|uniref:Uncharacterized protein n=1 Tax=Streptomyces arboris TaxID=2600619 RepID=A0A5N5EHP4_9ACTN|nr:hypothetical protein [Streptomyces arboris]KAB2588400.1 hypothetical protein F5983_32685 [Streptomyces arboris]